MDIYDPDWFPDKHWVEAANRLEAVIAKLAPKVGPVNTRVWLVQLSGIYLARKLRELVASGELSEGEAETSWAHALAPVLPLGPPVSGFAAAPRRTTVPVRDDGTVGPAAVVAYDSHTAAVREAGL